MHSIYLMTDLKSLAFSLINLELIDFNNQFNTAQIKFVYALQQQQNVHNNK